VYNYDESGVTDVWSVNVGWLLQCFLLTLHSVGWCLCVALILEEIAIDSHHADTEARLLDEAQELHLSSLMLAMRAFGENNVQTAKHYGNLGRLYQSMHKFAVSSASFITPKLFVPMERLSPIDMPLLFWKYWQLPSQGWFLFPSQSSCGPPVAGADWLVGQHTPTSIHSDQ